MISRASNFRNVRARRMRTNDTRRIRTLVDRIQPDAHQRRTETGHMLLIGAARRDARFDSARLGSARLDFDSSRLILIRSSAAGCFDASRMPQIKKTRGFPFSFFPPFFRYTEGWISIFQNRTRFDFSLTHRKVRISKINTKYKEKKD